jgi:hypothetical protein
MRFQNLIVLPSLLLSCALFAADNACLMEGDMTIGDQHIEIKDCLQNNGVDAKQFKEVCQSISNMTVAIGGAPAKITYMDACPSKPQASCDGFFGQPMTSYYYKRDAKLLANSKKGCEMQGGKWK